MKKRIFISMLATVFFTMLSGCSISFSDAGFLNGSIQEEDVQNIPNGAIVAETGNKIEMGDLTLILPNEMQYGKLNTDTGNVYYVWKTDASYVFPTDSDIILYAYEGNDITSPDTQLSDSEARYSIVQTYIQTFRECVNGKISADPVVISNDEWYALQLTGYSGDCISTSYGTMCYPKYYYGVYTLQKMTTNYNRNYYGFIFSNDSEGKIMGEDDYNNIYGQIKDAFSIKEFYTLPQLEYDESTDYSKGYSYEQLSALFADTSNYYNMSALQNEQQQTEIETGQEQNND